MASETENVVYLPQRQRSVGDHDVLRRVMRDHESALRRFLRARLANHPDYEDLVQDIYLRLARQEGLSAKLSMGQAQTRSYLFSIATNLIRDQYQRNSIRREVELSLATERGDPNHAPSPEEILIAQENLAAVRRAILRLPAKCRHAFLLSRFRDFSYREIAKEMNISISMVEKHIMRALATLRSCVRL